MNTSQTDEVFRQLRRDGPRLRDELFELLRYPTISAQSVRAGDLRAAAAWLRERFRRSGFSAEVIETAQHPAVFAEGPQRTRRPTVLVYGHYDVQPIGDATLWVHPPFEPKVVDGRIVARGAADDKGQMYAAVAAAVAWMTVARDTPVNVKFLIEGEEEIGSPNLSALVRANRARLACDCVLIHDTAQFAEGVPAVTAATKGLVYMEVILTGPKKDLHSGVYGGQVANPANALAALIASFHDERGRVTIPGFYERVVDLSESERSAIAALPFSESAMLADTGSPAAWGEAGYTTLERRWARPTLDVNGVYGGYMGEGSSTIIPSRAGAKISMRLVPEMRATEIKQAFMRAVHERVPPVVRTKIRTHAYCDPYGAPLDTPAMRAAQAAVERGYGVAPKMIREGGTLPILPLFKEALGVDSIMIGYCLPTCNAHSPNEFLHVGDFERGALTTAAFFSLLAEAG